MKLTIEKLKELIREEIDTNLKEVMSNRIRKKYLNRTKDIDYKGHKIRYYLIVPGEEDPNNYKDAEEAISDKTLDNNPNGTGHFLVQAKSGLEKEIMRNDGMIRNREDVEVYHTQRGQNPPRAVMLVRIPTPDAYQDLKSEIIAVNKILRVRK